MAKPACVRGILLSLLAVLWTASAACALTIVDDGRSSYSIVLPPNAIPAEVFAAEELARHIKEMSGADLKTVRDSEALPRRAIMLGNVSHLAGLGVKPDWKQIGKEGCLIRAVGEHLVIAGGRPRGTLYGVYSVLEDYWGCRWFAPDTSSIPKRPSLSLPALDLVAKPAFEYREPWIYAGWIRSKWWPAHFAPEYLPRTRNSSNQQNVHVFYKPIPGFDKYGGYFKIFPFAHNFSLLVPSEKHAKDHPEYFALNKDGNRVTVGDLELCLSNPDVARVAAETLAKWMRENPDAEMFFIGQSDTDQYCRCEKCMEARRKYGGWDAVHRKEIPASLGNDWWIGCGGFAGLNIEFVNRLAEIVEKEFPDRRIGTFAYSFTRRPPRNIKAHKNVTIWYCPIERCFCHSVDKGPINDTFYGFPAEIKAWSRIVNQVYVYDYSLLGALGQPLDLPTLRDSMQAYRKLKVDGVLVDSIPDIQAGFGFLRYWLWTELLRNPDFDVAAGTKEFMDAYYGAAAPHVWEYINLVSRPDSYEALSPESVKPWTGDPWKPVTYQQLLGCRLGQNRGLTKTAINAGYRIFQRAKAAVSDDPIALDHVLAARMCLQYSMLDKLAADDYRLKDEAVSLLTMLKRLEMPSAQDVGLDEYRAGLQKKLGVQLVE